jgi:hypothetical protein
VRPAVSPQRPVDGWGNAGRGSGVTWWFGKWCPQHSTEEAVAMLLIAPRWLRCAMCPPRFPALLHAAAAGVRHLVNRHGGHVLVSTVSRLQPYSTQGVLCVRRARAPCFNLDVEERYGISYHHSRMKAAL